MINDNQVKRNTDHIFIRICIHSYKCSLGKSVTKGYRRVNSVGKCMPSCSRPTFLTSVYAGSHFSRNLKQTYAC